jgi:hypothetical protein
MPFASLARLVRWSAASTNSASGEVGDPGVGDAGGVEEVLGGERLDDLALGAHETGQGGHAARS